jgi:hypothetical protein
MSQGFTSPLTLPLPVASGGTGVSNSNWTAGSLTFSPTTQGIVGTTTNDNAAAGYVGEYISSNVAYSSAITTTSNVAANITSISLTAGDWDVFGVCYFEASSQNSTYSAGWTSATSAAVPTPNEYFIVQSTTNQFIAQCLVTPIKRYSLSSTTTIYLGTVADGSGTRKACGTIFARRVR